MEKSDLGAAHAGAPMQIDGVFARRPMG